MQHLPNADWHSVYVLVLKYHISEVLFQKGEQEQNGNIHNKTKYNLPTIHKIITIRVHKAMGGCGHFVFIYKTGSKFRSLETGLFGGGLFFGFVFFFLVHINIKRNIKKKIKHGMGKIIVQNYPVHWRCSSITVSCLLNACSTHESLLQPSKTPQRYPEYSEG